MGMQMEYKEDDIIIKEDSLNKYMHLVLEGEVALYSNFGKKDEYLFGLVGRGKTFGEIGLLNHEESAYTAVAITPVKTATFSEFELSSFIRGYPDKALEIMRSIARMNQIYSLNMKMVLEENKDFVKYKEIYIDAVKRSKLSKLGR